MKLAVIGVTGAVGHEFLSVLFQRGFDASKLSVYASARSAGRQVAYGHQTLTVQALPEDGRIDADVALLSAGGSLSKELAPKLRSHGVIVIDNSSAWRYDDDVPLVVPEVNAYAIKQHKGIIANPNCTTAILAVALYPLHREFYAKRVIVSSYQAASGAGAKGMEELEQGTRLALDGQRVNNEVFAHPLPFNVIPHIDVFTDNGYTKEEMKVSWETRKIFNDPSLLISCTAVRVPTLRAHGEAVTVEFEKQLTPAMAREILRASAGVELVDDTAKKQYPMPMTASKKFDVEVGRIRQSLVFGDQGLDFFVVGDQLLKGAALNAVQIAEQLFS